MRFSLNRFIYALCAVFSVALRAGGAGRFGPHDGTNAEQTMWGAEATMYFAARNRTVIGPLSRSEDRMEQGEGDAIDGTAGIWRKPITKGDRVLFTLQELAAGLPTYGDKTPAMGDFLAYDQMEARVNRIKSPRFPEPGKMSQQRAGYTITNMPAAIERATTDWMGEQIEIEALIAAIYGASPSLLTTDDGPGVKLGISGAAGTPLMPRHFLTTEGGYETYNPTQATWNSQINTLLGAITAGAAGEITQASQDYLRYMLDTIKFQGISYGGTKYKAVNLCDPVVFLRLQNILLGAVKVLDLRGLSSAYFKSQYDLVWKEMRYVAVPNLIKLRPATDGVNLCPSIGVGTAANPLLYDPRTYTTSSSLCWMITLGAGGFLEGYNGRIGTTKYTGPHGESVDYMSQTMDGFMRGEWFPKDGGTDITRCISYGMALSCFYDRGVGTGYSY